MADQPILERLDDTDLTLADPADDVRGRTAVDEDDEGIGRVDGLFIDRDDRRVRFLEISSGGILGIGDTRQLVPVDAVAAVEEDRVRIDRRREHIAGGPAYDPDLVKQEPAYFAELYDYYGFAPFWAPGYLPPRYPFVGR